MSYFCDTKTSIHTRDASQGCKAEKKKHVSIAERCTETRGYLKLPGKAFLHDLNRVAERHIHEEMPPPYVAGRNGDKTHLVLT